MGNFKPSKYQEAILNYIENGTGNLLVDAKAGSGKTSTLLLISDILKQKQIKSMFLAFNKSIVEDLQIKLNNPDCKINTVHSVGLMFLKSYLYMLHGKDNYVLNITSDKVRSITKKYFEDICKQDIITFNRESMGEAELKKLLTDILNEFCKLVDFCRFYMCNYHMADRVIRLTPSVGSYLRDFENYGIDVNQIKDVVEKTIDEIKDRFEHPDRDQFGKPVYNIDFTDMVYFPVYYNMRYPYYLRWNLDYVLVDEAQDLSILQQKLIQKLNNGNTRYIFVGDEKQAIYGFAGADTKSIQNIKSNFQLNELPLNICYRCPEKVIRLTQDIVPDIEWNSVREDRGIVDIVKPLEFQDQLKPGDHILCRYNFRLLYIFKYLCFDKKIKVRFKNTKLADNILKEVESTILEYIDRYNKFINIESELSVFLKDKDIPSNPLNRSKKQDDLVKAEAVKLIQKNKKSGKKICKQNHSIDYLILCMQEYKEKGGYLYGDSNELLVDYYSLIEQFIEMFKQDEDSYTVKSFLEYVKKFLYTSEDSDAPVLTTVHMMKGGECDRLFIFDYPLFPYQSGRKTEDENQQEENLKYVAITRAKKELYVIECDTTEKTLKDFHGNEEMYNKWLERLKKANEKCSDRIAQLNKQMDLGIKLI